MFETPRQALRSLLALGLAPDGVARVLVRDFGYPATLAARLSREAARAGQEEEIEFAHTVIEHEAALAGEWRE